MWLWLGCMQLVKLVLWYVFMIVVMLSELQFDRCVVFLKLLFVLIFMLWMCVKWMWFIVLNLCMSVLMLFLGLVLSEFEYSVNLFVGELMRCMICVRLLWFFMMCGSLKIGCGGLLGWIVIFMLVFLVIGMIVFRKYLRLVYSVFLLMLWQLVSSVCNCLGWQLEFQLGSVMLLFGLIWLIVLVLNVRQVELLLSVFDSLVCVQLNMGMKLQQMMWILVVLRWWMVCWQWLIRWLWFGLLSLMFLCIGIDLMMLNCRLVCLIVVFSVLILCVGQILFIGLLQIVDMMCVMLGIWWMYCSEIGLDLLY